MALADDIRDLTADSLARLDRVRDYYFHSREAWDELRAVAATRPAVVITNPETGTAFDYARLAAESRAYTDDFLKPAVLGSLLSVFEDFVFDLLRLWLTAYPGKLHKKQIELEAVLAAGGIPAVLQAVIDRELNSLKYERVAAWFDYLGRLVTVPPPPAEELAAVAEMKATRDVLVHNNGVVNATYVAKAGGKGRYAVGDLMELPDPYVRLSADALRRLIAAVGDAVGLRA